MVNHKPEWIKLNVSKYPSKVGARLFCVGGTVCVCPCGQLLGDLKLDLGVCFDWSYHVAQLHAIRFWFQQNTGRRDCEQKARDTLFVREKTNSQSPNTAAAAHYDETVFLK